MVRCPGCGEENPAKFRLCGYCGAQLARPVAAEEVRKTVTIVFCDLKGSTSLAERLDSESMREVLSVYFAAMSQVLERHGGTVEKFIGDAIMAVFGLPRLHEDDALRAVRAAFEIKSALRELNVRLQATWGITLQNRTGVNTGEVVAGDISTGQRLATGDTVNVAARLEQAAPDGEILIGDLTFRLTRDAVRVAPVEPLELKGKSDRVPAFRLLGVSGGEAITRRVDLPLIGRDEPFGQLHITFGRVAAGPRSEVVAVLGQAGVGKTRLVEEFVRQVGDRAQVLRSRCLSYGEGITFWPLAEVLRQAAGISPDDRGEAALAKLSSLAGTGHEDVTRRVASLMGDGPESYGKEELIWAARTVLQIAAQRKPLIVIIDDIHWAEPGLLDVIEHLASGLSAGPLLVVCTARHELVEERPGFLENRDGAVRIELRELTSEDMTQVLANLLGDTRLPQSLMDRIIAVAGGIPLFAEQMVSMLADSGAIVERGDQWEFTGPLDDVKVPQNVSSLLASRLDRLQSAERGVVERAAVIGIDFQTDALSALALDRDAVIDLAPPLSALCGKRLIRQSRVSHDGYQFANLLVRDVAYDRLLKRTRARMHERVAEWLVEVSGDRLAELEEIIGFHEEQSFRYRGELGPIDEQGRSLGDRAAAHLGAAGSRAFDRGDMHAAASLLQRAADLLEAGHADRPQLLLEAGEALGDLGKLDVAEARFEEARRIAALIGDDAAARSAELAQLHLRFITGATGAEVSVPARVQELIGVLEAAGDDLGLARAWRLMTYVHGMASQFGLAAAAANRAISHAERAGNQVMARRSSGLLVISALSGSTPVDEATRICEANIAQAADDRKALAITEAALAHLEAMRGNFEQARVRYRRSRALLEEYGYILFAALTSMDSAPAEMLAQDLEAAEHELRGDYQTLEQMGERAYLSSTAGLLAEVLYRQGRYDQSAEFAAVCEDLASDDDVASQFLWRRVRAKLLATSGQHEQAETLITQAIEMIGATDWLDWQGDGFMDLAELHRLGGRFGQALEALSLATDRFTAKGNIVSAKHAADLASELSVRSG